MPAYNSIEMALNCPVDVNGQPIKVEGETLLVYRDQVELEVKMDGVGKRIAKGRVLRFFDAGVPVQPKDRIRG